MCARSDDSVWVAGAWGGKFARDDAREMRGVYTPDASQLLERLGTRLCDGVIMSQNLFLFKVN